MSGLIDTNILIYAVNRDSPHHALARSFLEKILEGGDTLYLCWAVLYEFLRVTTHPKVFRAPLSWEEACRFLESFLQSKNVRILAEGDEHLEALKALLREIRNPRGNLMHDAHIAAVLQENGLGTVYTHDTDFRLFPLLEVVDQRVIGTPSFSSFFRTFHPPQWLKNGA